MKTGVNFFVSNNIHMGNKASTKYAEVGSSLDDDELVRKFHTEPNRANYNRLMISKYLKNTWFDKLARYIYPTLPNNSRNVNNWVHVKITHLLTGKITDPNEIDELLMAHYITGSAKCLARITLLMESPYPEVKSRAFWVMEMDR
jgi:hypothetical protein